MTDGHCFISYSTADALDFARKLADELEGGYPFIKAWFDKRNMKPGDDWDDQISEAIKNCKCLLFVLTRDSVAENSGCKPEWTMALHYKKPVLPLRLHTDAALPFRLGSRQYVDFSGNFEAGLAQLRKHLAWMDSPAGALQALKDRLADAERGLRRAAPGDEARVKTEITELKAEIQRQQELIDHPEAKSRPLPEPGKRTRNKTAEKPAKPRVGTRKKQALKVFLSYAHADKNEVKALYTRLVADGVDAWLDKEKILPGMDWEFETRKAVTESHVVVVCLSQQFNQEGYRQKEVRIALEEAEKKPEGMIFIIPARLEECENLHSLHRWHWVDLFEPDGYDYLLRALRARATELGI